MATKDWKKTYEISNFTRYESKKLTIGIWTTPAEVSVMNNITSETLTTRTFNSSSEAQAFAKSYMRKN